MKILGKATNWQRTKGRTVSACRIYCKMERDRKKKIESVLDFSRQAMESFPSPSMMRFQPHFITHINLVGNKISCLPSEISNFSSLVALDMSSNQLKCLPRELGKLENLKKLLLKNNFLQELPQEIISCQSLRIVNLSGNKFLQFPGEIFELPQLEHLYLGGNLIHEIPNEIAVMCCLESLYLGGNKLSAVPDELGKLYRLKMLNLCDNKIKSIPKELSKLHLLESLSLHNNNLTVLPIAIVKLRNLQAISMRGNPLVMRFVRSQSTSVPTLQELTGKTIKNNNIPYSDDILPARLVKFLDSARKCVNPKCRGVFFESCVRHVKFVDFCGKYRLPFEQFLCSPHDNEQWEDIVSSSSSTSSDDDEGSPAPSWMKKILLG